MVPTNRSATALAFGARTGVWITRIPSVLNTLSKLACELAVVVTDQELQGPLALRERGHEVPGLLRCPRAVGVLGHAGEVHAPGGKLDEEQHVGPPEGDRVDCEEVVWGNCWWSRVSSRWMRGRWASSASVAAVRVLGQVVRVRPIAVAKRMFAV